MRDRSKQSKSFNDKSTLITKFPHVSRGLDNERLASQWQARARQSNYIVLKLGSSFSRGRGKYAKGRTRRNNSRVSRHDSQEAGVTSTCTERSSVLRIKFVSDRLFISTWLLPVSDTAAPLRSLCK